MAVTVLGGTMKRHTAYLIAILSASLIGAVSQTAWAQKPTATGGQALTTIVAVEGHITKKSLDVLSPSDVAQLVNSTSSPADFDFIVINQQGEEADRNTVELVGNSKRRIKLEEVFPSLAFGDASAVEIQASVRPADAGDSVKVTTMLATNQALLPVAFFSQRDPRWANNRLGTCSTTIGKQGCAVASVAMSGARSVYNFNPATLNTYLTNNGGYQSGCSIVWSVAAKIDGSAGFTYIGTGSVSSASNLKSVISQNRFAVAKSYRFYPTSDHWVIIIGYYNQGYYLSDFVYLDPWDLTATFRRVNDGWVTATSATRIYQ
jgi:hypothetical protein